MQRVNTTCILSSRDGASRWWAGGRREDLRISYFLWEFYALTFRFNYLDNKESPCYYSLLVPWQSEDTFLSYRCLLLCESLRDYSCKRSSALLFNTQYHACFESRTWLVICTKCY
jgi:hypothetical protein